MTLKTLGQLLVSGSSSCSRNRCLSCSVAPQSFAKGNCSFFIIIYFPNGFSWSFILFCSLSSRTHLLLINVISVFPLSLISPSTAPFNCSYCAHSWCSMKVLPSEKAFRLPSFSDWNVLICSFHFYISMSSPILSDTLRCSSFKILFFFLKSQLRKKKKLFILWENEHAVNVICTVNRL